VCARACACACACRQPLADIFCFPDTRSALSPPPPPPVCVCVCVDQSGITTQLSWFFMEQGRSFVVVEHDAEQQGSLTATGDSADNELSSQPNPKKRERYTIANLACEMCRTRVWCH
jgi:hypothetical protein